MPKAVNPAAGYIANANNDPVGATLDNNPLNQVRPGGGLYYLNPGYAALRMGRIDRELQAMVAQGEVSLQDMAALQANNQLIDGEILTPYIVQAFANAASSEAWPGTAQFLADPRVVEAAERLAAWDFSTPTGIGAGYDPFDDPDNLPEPSQAEIDASVAATLYAMWRGRMIENTIDAVLDGIGLGAYKPGSRQALSAMAWLLQGFDRFQGTGASGIPFFNVPELAPPTPADARDFVILASLKQSLDLLASEAFKPAFGQSTNLEDYRWGLLHRIVFDHPLGADQFNVPNSSGEFEVMPGLPGVARSGGRGAVDASSHSARAGSLNGFMFGAGPARRFIGYVTPEGPVGQEVIPGGRSGLFFSPHYADQMPLWLTNRYHPLTLGEGDADATEVATFQFLPVVP
ncbi:MAG: penicillin acylase family protein, partial [Xanthomonadales bacterium]|nr:penicillin acylase family protein [Xanthomonadales bacterium]